MAPSSRRSDAVTSPLPVPAASGPRPLAARMRPRTLDEVVGQADVLGPEGALRRMATAGRLVSMVLWGPPGVGKTTLARLLADAVAAPLESLSATASGVKDVRAIVARARDRVAIDGVATVLFIDEIHRFNKSQQDTLLPDVEEGTVTLVGATTENPYFEVNSALLSRTRVFRLDPLADEDVRTLVERARDDARGFDGRLVIAGEAIDHLVSISAGDARVALNILEAAAALASEGDEVVPSRAVSVADVEAAAQQRVLSYDRAGDGHYGTVSAFIKSMRGNDPDAALYWLAAMVAAGEDPKFIARRIIIAASEDVGNADPRALQVAVSAAQALDWIGLPEAQYALAQATVYVATAPKSNRSGAAYWAALADVREHGSQPVPGHLVNAADRRMKRHGLGVGYQDPHDHPGADVEQRYLPDKLLARRYYQPSDQGWEARIRERMDALTAARKETVR